MAIGTYWKNAMRILFLTNAYPPLGGGGYEQLCKEVADGLKARGHEVGVVTSNYRVADIPLAEQGVYRILNHEVDLRRYRGTLGFFTNRKQRLQETLLRFQEILTNFQPDILFVWSMWNLPPELLVLAGGWPSLKIVYYLADYWPTLPDAYTLHWQETARRWYTLLPKLLLGRIALATQAQRNRTSELKFEHALCVSQAVRQRLIADGVLSTEARVVHNGIDLAPFLAAGELRPRHQPRDHLTLLYAGRIEPIKGVHTAIEAVAELSYRGHAVTLTLVGGRDPNYLKKLHHLCERLKVSDRVEFLKPVSREQMPELMAQFDVLIFASIWPEPLARIVQEAMAVGLVVVGTDVGGMSEILIDGMNGLTFTPEDAKELAIQIERLILDANLRHQFIEAGQQTTREKFNIEHMLDQVETYLQDLVVKQRASYHNR